MLTKGVVRASIILGLIVSSSPALAADVLLPEPSNLALFGLGVLGVIIGRQSSRRRRD